MAMLLQPAQLFTSSLSSSSANSNLPFLSNRQIPPQFLSLLSHSNLTVPGKFEHLLLFMFVLAFARRLSGIVF